MKTLNAGLYEVSPDHNAILGPVPDLPRFVLANGFSGHGMQHAPAVGKAISEVIADWESRTLDVSAFSVARFVGNAGAPEKNAICCLSGSIEEGVLAAALNTSPLTKLLDLGSASHATELQLPMRPWRVRSMARPRSRRMTDTSRGKPFADIFPLRPKDRTDIIVSHSVLDGLRNRSFGVVQYRVCTGSM